MQTANEQLEASAGPNTEATSQCAEPEFPNKMTSLGEVQRIIGLSLSKIQLGRNQRGGLPLHKNLLVATVLNKARDLYMQETMYMNYKMMTGQFAAAASNQMTPDQIHQQGYHYHHHYPTSNPPGGGPSNANDDINEPTVEANEADYDEDSESDVEDECDVVSNPQPMTGLQYPPTTMASMLSLHMHMQQQQQQIQQQAAQVQPESSEPPSAAAASPPTAAAAAAAAVKKTLVNSDEGFIDEPDCDCDARNFSTSESRVPFQYCYNCAPFHPSNGRGPTLVPSPCPASPGKDQNVIYDMDRQHHHTEVKVDQKQHRGKKRRRTSSDEADDEVDDKKRRDSTSPNSSLDESGYLSDSNQQEVSNQLLRPFTYKILHRFYLLFQMFHPAFRGTSATTTTTSETTSTSSVGQTMEIDQITSLVSIFSFGQHIMAAAAAASSSNGKLDEEEPKKEEKKSDQHSSEDSDSESDTSSDSGHSSDDHEAAKEAEDQASSGGTKLTRSVSTPELCSTAVVISGASEAPPCVEVASL